MKTNSWLALALTLFPLCAYGQVSPSIQSSAPVIVLSGPHHRVWQTLTVDEDGQTYTGSFTEIATGLNYWNPATDRYEESKASFQIAEDGSAIATHGQHQVRLAADINSGASVNLVMPDGERLLSNPMGLSFFDYSSGKTSFWPKSPTALVNLSLRTWWFTPARLTR